MHKKITTKKLAIAAVSLIFATSCKTNTETTMKNNIQPPVAKKIPHELEKFGNKRTDNYFWLNQRENPEVIDYLNAENKYYQEMTAHTKEFQNSLF